MEKGLNLDQPLQITLIQGKIPQFEKYQTKPKKPTGWGARHTLALLGFWAVAVNYMMRYNLSIAIVAMVNSNLTIASSSAKPDNGSSITSGGSAACPIPAEDANYTAGISEIDNSGESGEFNWSPADQGLILGCFFWGYLATQIPAGLVSSRFGGKWPLGIGLLITAILAIFTPWAARTHVWLLIGFRIVQGLGEGMTIPAMHGILANWAPPEERGQMSSFVYAGAQVGTAMTMIISGYLIHGDVMGGWPSVFYFFGVVSVVWFVLWTFLMYDKPSDHPRISREERNYIEKSIGAGARSDNSHPPVPWKDIFLSMPFWAILICQTGHCWGLYTLLAQLPTYLKTVLQFDIKQNSWLSALPHIVMSIVSLTVPRIADWFLSKGILRTITLRKTCTGIAHIGSALALIAASYSGCDRLTTVFLLTLALGFNGTIYAGVLVNHVDIAPNYASVLMGIANTAGSFMGFAAPYVCGLLIDGDPSLRNWQFVFFIAAGIYIFDFVFFVAFATSDEQWWNRGRRSLSNTRDSCVLKKLKSNNKA